MQVQSNTSIMHLEDLPLDVGYASEEVTLKNIDNKHQTLGGHNGKTQLIITTPKIDDGFLEELKSINSSLPQGGEYEVTASLVVANDSHINPELENIKFFVDEQDEFGDFYGVRLKGEPYDKELTKALILISKDGAIFYDEFTPNLEDKFNLETLDRKILAAQVCYTGKGCH